MNHKKMPYLKIGDREATLPIIQGGMGVGISLSGLACAVANEGGIGVISATGIGMFEPDVHTNTKEANNRALRKEIKKARAGTSGLIGVNILVALCDFFDLTRAAVEENADFVFLGAGLPIRFPETGSNELLSKILDKVIPIVSSAKAANLIFKVWEKDYGRLPNAVVVEGPLAGGHLGFKKEQLEDPSFKLEQLVTDVISEVQPFEKRFNKKIPVIAGGGIYTGRDIYEFIQLGASGVQMSTRFVATHECDASIAFKEEYLKCREEDLIIIDSPVGLPGRAIKNSYLDDVSHGIKKPFKCPWKCLRTCNVEEAPYCIAAALTNAKRGNLDNGFAFAGANAHRIDKIVSVTELIRELVREYEES